MSLFDVEHLQKLTYERSKDWANLVDALVKRETLEEMDITDFDYVFASECDENDSYDELVSMEDDECDMSINSEVLRNVTNTTRINLLFNSKSLVLPDSSRTVEQNDFIDIFNETLPIINEHNRQLKEFGLDKILISFDKKKIEEKVGGWLNRHNSLYGGDNTMLYDVAKNKGDEIDRHLNPNTRHIAEKSRRKEVSDSDDSLQSGETARYIRSSRTGAIKKSASTTTMIKTYRMVKSTREALREKYACEMDDEDDHLKSMRHRRKVSNLQYRESHCDLDRFYKPHKYDVTPLSPLKLRRKVFRKRTCSNSCSTIDSSSDSDYCYEDYRRSHRKHLNPCCRHRSNYQPTFAAISANKEVKTQRSAMKMPSARMDRIYYYLHPETKSVLSSSSNSFSSVREKRRKIKRSTNLCNCIPSKLESECHCCYDRKLYGEFKHVAETSTEQWYVENSCSAKKLAKAPSTNTKQYKLAASAGDKLSSAIKRDKNKSKANINKLQFINETPSKPKTKQKSYSKEESDTSTEDSLVESCRPRKKITKTPTNNIKSYKSVVSVDEKLSSKTQLVEEDLKTKSKSKANSKKLINEKTAIPKSKTTKTKKTSLKDEPLSQAEATDWELQMAMEESKKTYEREQMMKKEENNKISKGMLKKENKREILEFIPLRKTLENKGDKISNPTQAIHKKAKTKSKNATVDEVEKIEELPKLIKKENNEVAILNFDTDDSIESNLTTMKMSTTKNQNSLTNSRGETFFQSNQAICNSTALCTKSKAHNRQIADQLAEQAEEEENEMSQNKTAIELKKPVRKETKLKNSTKRKATSFTTAKQKGQMQKLAASSTVTSTTLRSPEITFKLNIKQFGINKFEQNKEMNGEDHSDCTLVTSTTHIEASFASTGNEKLEKTQQHHTTLNSNNKQMTQRGILIYTPENRNMAPANSFTNDGFFTITKEHLSSIIGEKQAKKFLKYYVGRKRFTTDSTVYYRPPTATAAGDNNETSSSDSADDLDNLGQYGDLYAITK